MFYYGKIEFMDGKTAIKYFQPGRKLIRVGDTEYVFMTKANICLAWVDDEDVSRVLSMRNSKRCCGGGKKPIFFLANEDDIRRWTNGGGR